MASVKNWFNRIKDNFQTGARAVERQISNVSDTVDNVRG